MIKVLELAVEKVKGLSAERQAYAASVLEEIAASGSGVYPLSDEERVQVREGVADLDAGRVVADAAMTAFWDRNRA